MCAVSKTTVKDDFVRFCYDTCIGMPDERPITQESIDVTFRTFVSELFNQGDISKLQCADWYKEGSGFTVESLTKRINETDAEFMDRLDNRAYQKLHPGHMVR